MLHEWTDIDLAASMSFWFFASPLVKVCNKNQANRTFSEQKLRSWHLFVSYIEVAQGIKKERLGTQSNTSSQEWNYMTWLFYAYT